MGTFVTPNLGLYNGAIDSPPPNLTGYILGDKATLINGDKNTGCGSDAGYNRVYESYGLDLGSAQTVESFKLYDDNAQGSGPLTSGQIIVLYGSNNNNWTELETVSHPTSMVRSGNTITCTLATPTRARYWRLYIAGVVGVDASAVEFSELEAYAQVVETDTKETWTIIPLESVWDGGYDWDDPRFLWDNGLDDGGFGFDMDFSGSQIPWTACLLIDGHIASNHDANHHAVDFQTLYAQWNLSQLPEDTTNLWLRLRLYNRHSSEYGDYQYYGPFNAETPYTISFQGWTGTPPISYRWLPSQPPDYPTDIMNPKVNVTQFKSVTGRIQSTVFSTHPNTFELFFPSLTLTDINNLRSFLLNMDYKKNAFLYNCKETNPDDPFAGVWNSIWVKLANDKIEYKRIRGTDHYNLTIKLRQCQPAIARMGTGVTA